MSPTPFASTLAHIHRHEEDHGFCMVCGGVWPCWRASRTPAGAAADGAGNYALAARRRRRRPRAHAMASIGGSGG
jgi:hypothetical protein